MRQCERVAGSESHPWDRKRMVAGSEGRGRAGTLGVGLLMVSVTLVSANSPPRFLLETNVGSEIVLRLREGPRQQNNSILGSVQCSGLPPLRGNHNLFHSFLYSTF